MAARVTRSETRSGDPHAESTLIRSPEGCQSQVEHPQDESFASLRARPTSDRSGSKLCVALSDVPFVYRMEGCCLAWWEEILAIARSSSQSRTFGR